MPYRKILHYSVRILLYSGGKAIHLPAVKGPTILYENVVILRLIGHTPVEEVEVHQNCDKLSLPRPRSGSLAPLFSLVSGICWACSVAAA